MIFSTPASIVILYSIIAILLLVILVVFSAVLIRRFYKERFFTALDREREVYAPLVDALVSSAPVDMSLFENQINSIKWLAVEELLLKAIDGAATDGAATDGAATDEAGKVKSDRARESFEALGITDIYLADLKSSNKYRASLCADRLGRIKCERAVPELIQSLKSDSRDIKNMAVNALGLIGDESAISPLMERFREVIDETEDISGRIIKNALIAFGPGAVPHLLTELGSSLWRVRSRVLDVLCEIDDPSLKEVFLSALTDQDECSIELFKRAVSDANWQVRRAASEALGGFGLSAIKELTDVMLRSTDRFARQQVAEELQRSGLIYAIVESLRNPAGIKPAEDMLFDVGSNGVVSPLLDAMDDPDPIMRCKVAMLLGRIGNFRAREVLERSARDDENLKVKLEAGKALETVPHEDPAAA
jgi:HEAT repeat protein